MKKAYLFAEEGYMRLCIEIENLDAGNEIDTYTKKLEKEFDVHPDYQLAEAFGDRPAEFSIEVACEYDHRDASEFINAVIKHFDLRFESCAINDRYDVACKTI